VSTDIAARTSPLSHHGRPGDAQVSLRCRSVRSALVPEDPIVNWSGHVDNTTTSTRGGHACGASE
jgi:hypothetical protein